MFSKRMKRAAGVIAASALLVAGGTAAQAITTDDIYPNEDTDYYGWHQGDKDGETSYEVQWDRLRLGFDGPAQIINGLVDKGEHPNAEDRLSADELIELIEDSGLDDTTGSIYYQVGMFYLPEGEADDVANLKWTTLRPATAAPESDEEFYFSAADDWTGTGDLGGIVKPLGDLVNDIGAQYFEVVGYGVYASTDSSVRWIKFDGYWDYFGFDSNWLYADEDNEKPTRLDDFEGTVFGDVAEVCGALLVGESEDGGLIFDLDSYPITGETTEDRWANLVGLLESLDGAYPYVDDEDADQWYEDENAGWFVLGATISYGLGDGDDQQFTLGADGSSFDSYFVPVLSGDIPDFINEGDRLGDIVNDLVTSDYQIAVDSVLVGNENGFVHLHSVWLGELINVSFPGVCEVETPETPVVPETPAEPNAPTPKPKADPAKKPGKKAPAANAVDGFVPPFAG